MAFVSNQWLKDTYIDRGHLPVPVSISVNPPYEDWSKRRKIVVEFTARRKTTYQTLHFNQREAAEAVDVIIAQVGGKTRSKVMRKLLNNLSDERLLKAIASELRNRLGKLRKPVRR